tara:strand:- start:96 stop:812 length:717 start_codon:yes stop_codon:yes gene_type:complete
MDFLFGVFTGAFAFPVVLWATLSWWALIIVIGGIVWTEVAFYRDSHLGAFTVLMGVIVFSIFMMSDAEGWWQLLQAVVVGTLLVLVKYVLWGLFAVVPLYLWHARKYYEDLREKLTAFIKEKVKQDKESDRYGPLLSEADKSMCRQYKSGEPIPECIKEAWVKYRSDYLDIDPDSIKVINNLETVSSMIFLWPFHIITMVFGDFLAKIPEWFARTFGKLLDRMVRTVRWGIPSGIDGD